MRSERKRSESERRMSPPYWDLDECGDYIIAADEAAQALAHLENLHRPHPWCPPRLRQAGVGDGGAAAIASFFESDQVDHRAADFFDVGDRNRRNGRHPAGRPHRVESAGL